MTVDIEVIPISADTDGFYATILRIGSIRILLDCGWTERMDVEQYAQLSPDLFNQIDLVLLSHYSLNHVGALPYLLFRNWGRKLRFMQDFEGPRIVATEAVRRLAELSLASLHEDLEMVKNVTVSDDSYTMTLEDIVSAFSHVQPVQYNEAVSIEKNGEKLTVTCQPAGRLMGGAYFVITVGSQRIVYATDYSLSSGKAVSGLSMEPAKACSVLITDTAPVPPANNSDIQIGTSAGLLSACKQTLRSGGTVLMPADHTGDVLELLLLLEQAYSDDASMQVYPVVFVSPLGDVVLDQVKTRMEWMNGHVLHDFEESVNFTAHPFILQHIDLCPNLHDFFEKFPKNSPKILLSTCPSLDFGDSRELFVRFASDANNLVVLTGDRPPLEGSLAHQLISRFKATGSPGEMIVSQFIKSPLSDEQLRQVYRECLEKEAQDDELRRRRIRERMPQQATAAAPSSAAAVPVDLIRGGVGVFEGDSAGGNFFRPQLFAAQTVSSGAVVAAQRQVTDYGEQLNQIEVDTWRAHAEMSDLGAAREAAAEQASMVKAEKMVTGEIRIKGDIGNDDRVVKGELGITSAAAGGGESFDWRRDLQVRFGEPQKVEARERVVKVGCKLRVYSSQANKSHHRREFVTSVHAQSVIVLPSRNLHDIQLVSLMVRSEGRNFYATQEDTVPSLESEAALTPIPISVSLAMTAEKKWVHIDPQVLLPFKGMLDSSDVRIARLEGTELVGPVVAPPDLIQVPNGEYIDYTIAPEFSSSKRHKSSNPGGSILVSSKPFRLTEFANLLRKSLPVGSTVEFKSTCGDNGRVLSVQAMGGQVVIVGANKSSPSSCPVVEILGTPSPCFYKVRELLYSASIVI